MQFETLVTNISTKSQSFGERINDAYLKLDNIKVEALRKRQEQLIESIIGDYYETVDKLVKNFRKILDEEIQNLALRQIPRAWKADSRGRTAGEPGFCQKPGFWPIIPC
jgi:uncharacterized protein YaaN involved in tellurite resistance